MASGVGGFGGGSAGTATLRMTLDAGQYQSQLASAQGKTVSSVSKMGSSYQSLAKYAKQALGALAGTQILRMSIQAYDEQAKAVARLNMALGNSPSITRAASAALIEQASALSKLTGIQDEQIIGAQAALTVFGLTQEQLQALTPVVLDYAAFTGTDVTSAATAMGRAVLGNARALKTIGIDFQRTGNVAADFEQVMTLVGEKVGGSAEAMATPMDKMRVAANEAMESIGGALAPTLETLSQILSILPPGVLALAAAFLALKLAGKDAAGIMAKWGPYAIAAVQGFRFLNDVISEGESFWDALGNQMEDVLNIMGLFPDKSAIAGALVTAAEVNPTSSLAAALRDAQAEAEGFASATDQAKDALLELIAAEYQLAGGMLGMVASFRSAKDASAELASARAELAALERAGKQGTDEWSAATRNLNDAQLSSVQAQLALENAIVAHTQALQEGGGSRDQAIADIRAMGARAGLTAGEISVLIGRILAIPDNSYTNIQVDSAAALNEIAAVINAVAAIPSYKTVSVSVVTSGAAQYGGQLALAEGGIIKGASGFITKGPTMLSPNIMVGEGRSAGGYSPEAVIPLNAQGKGILREVFSEVMGRGGGGVLKVYGPGDPDLIADAVIRKMARMR